MRPEPLRCRSRRRPSGPVELPQQQGAAVAEPWDEAAELVAGVRLGDRRRVLGQRGADQEADPLGRAQPVGVEAELGRERLVEREQLRRGRLLGLPTDGELGELARVAVTKGHGGGGCEAHPSSVRRAG